MAWYTSSQNLAEACDEISTDLQKNETIKNIADPS